MKCDKCNKEASKFIIICEDCYMPVYLSWKMKKESEK